LKPNGYLGLLASARNGAAPQRSWYSVRNLADGEAEVFIYDVIGDSWFGGVTAADFVRDLRAINATRILLRINSPGGAISDAVAIRTALVEHPAAIETHIDGLAASAASWVGLAAEKVVMARHATMMIHEPLDIMVGNAEDMRKMAEMLDHFGDDIAKMFQEKAGGEVDEWRERMREETWYSDEEAVAAGLADEIAAQETPAENRYDPGILAIFKNSPPHLVGGNKDRGEGTPTPGPAADRPEELVRAVLGYQRDQSRRIGVGV